MARISLKNLKPLSEKDEKFVENLTSPEYADGDGVRRAYIDAGYADSRSSLSNARTKMRALNEHIQVRIHERIGNHVPWALKELRKLAESAKNEQVKLKALIDILNRAGYASPIVIEHQRDDAKELTKEELRKEVQVLFDKAMGNKPQLKAVGGTDVHPGSEEQSES